MPDDRLRLLRYELVGHLGQVLHRRRLLDAQRRPHHHEVRDQHQEHQQLHRKRHGNGRAGVGGLHMQRMQQASRKTAEMVIQKIGEKCLDRHIEKIKEGLCP